MGTHSVAEARERLPELIERARNGEAIVITQDGDAVVELKPVPPSTARASLEWVRANRPKRLKKTIDSVALVRAMRDEGDH